MNHHYNPTLKMHARELRTDSKSKAEKYLWKAALSRNQMGVKFKRQRPILNFIVDFFCAEIKLIIEIDGNSHRDKGSYDQYRQNLLETKGYTVIRYTEGEVLNCIADVENNIRHVIYCLKEKWVLK
jgi:very-short-patch-repair endonuclease